MMREELAYRYGQELADTLIGDAREEYEKLIPVTPFIEGARGRALNRFVLIAAQELAAYKAMQRSGKPPAEAWELCHQALRLRVAEIAPWKRRLLGRLMFSSLVRKVAARRGRQRKTASIGEFEVEYLSDEGEDFDLGVNYLQCGIVRFMTEHGGEAFAPYTCMSDIVLSDALGWGLVRTQTLADGCSHCDFRFKKGEATQISSKTAEVQDTIDRIREREAAIESLCTSSPM